MKSTENKISSEKITGQAAGGFHAENFRRRSRCILVFVILLIAFAMIAGERKREFAVLRLPGSSRAILIGLVLKESALCSLAGGVLGVLLASLIVFPFTTLIETKLGLPYLRPEISFVTLLELTSLAATVMIGAAASAWTSFRLSRVDPGTVLREGN